MGRGVKAERIDDLGARTQEMKIERLRGWRIASAVPSGLDDCCLIVPTYCRPREVVKLLETVNALPDHPAETIVVDGSQDELTERAVRRWVADQHAGFSLLYARSRAGLTRQRNVGIDLASGEYVFFLDDDCLPQAGYFAAIRDVFLADERVGAVGGLAINQMAQPVPRRWRIRLSLKVVPRVEPGTYHASGTSVPPNLVRPFTGTRAVDLLCGAHFAFRRAVFARHRFSEFFAGYAQGEDMEFSLRVGREWKLLWCGDARVAHHHAPGGRPAPFAKGKMEVRNRYFIWKRHTTDVHLVDRARFWFDVILLAAMDVAWFCSRPWQLGWAQHAIGVACGAVGCALSPPRYEERLPSVRYVLAEGDDDHASGWS